MGDSLQVVIYGQSIAWAAVESVLQKSPNISIIKITEPEQWGNLAALGVDIVLFDESKPSFHIERLKRQIPLGISLLGLNFDKSRLMLYVSHPNNLPVLSELAQMIQRDAPRPGV